MNKYEKNEKFIAIVAVVLFVISLLPIFYLTFINRASGDDYSYGAYTRNAWMATHSIGAVLTAIGQTIKQYYIGWQGTWFSIILFSLQPEVFSDNAYFIVAPIMLFLWIGSACYLGREVLQRRLGYSKWSTCLQLVIILFISIQLIPSTKSSIFWWNGCVHYLVPFAMCQFVLAWVIKYLDSYSAKYLVLLTVFMTLLGGSSYQPALFALIVAGYAVVYGVWRCVHTSKNDLKRVILLLMPIVLEMIGLIISAAAPGNKVRGGEEFGFTIGKAFVTIGLSFAYGVKDMWIYVKERPLVYVGLMVYIVAVVLGQKTRNAGFMQMSGCEAVSDGDNVSDKLRINKVGSVVLVLAAFCLYSAMQAPAIFANVDVSRGVLNFNFQCFVLLMVVVILSLTNGLVSHDELMNKLFSKMCIIPYALILLVALFFARHNIKTTTDWVSMDYILSGQAADYKYQMNLQTELLESDESDVILPMINEYQGPLMHMPVIEDKEAWTNRTVAEFYHKNSTLGVDRKEWEESRLFKIAVRAISLTAILMGRINK